MSEQIQRERAWLQTELTTNDEQLQCALSIVEQLKDALEGEGEDRTRQQQAKEHAEAGAVEDRRRALELDQMCGRLEEELRVRAKEVEEASIKAAALSRDKEGLFRAKEDARAEVLALEKEVLEEREQRLAEQHDRAKEREQNARAQAFVRTVQLQLMDALALQVFAAVCARARSFSRSISHALSLGGRFSR